MRFLKLAVTAYGHDRTRPVIGADDIWINLDQVVSIEEQLDSNTFADAVRDGFAPEEHYPCVELTMSNGSVHIVSLGVYPTQAAGFTALIRFVPWLISGTMDENGRVIDADAIGPNLTRATATLVRTPRAPAAP